MHSEELLPIPLLECDLALSHWGAYEIGGRGHAPLLSPWREDPHPSPIGLSMLEAYRSPLRVRRPAVRAGWLSKRDRTGRGKDRFIEIPWDEALDLVARELASTIAEHGNASIFGGSYGWASAGRFHHALSQVHRFLGSCGGYVRSTDSYSLGAGRVLMPHIVADMDQLKDSHHSWEVMAEHTRLFLCFGGVPVKNAQISAGGAMQHHAPGGLAELVRRGCRFVHIGPIRSDLDLPAHAMEWIPIRPNTDTAALLGIACELIRSNRHDTGFLATHCTGAQTWIAYLLGEHDGVIKSCEWAEAITGVPAERLRRLAHELADTRSFINLAWSLQRADHGEQPFWAGVGVASLLGQIGSPGGGFGVGYGPANVMGSPYERIPGPTFPQGGNKVSAFIPCARVADMLLHPNEAFDYNGKTQSYPDIRLVYWAGGNPFHHHQDLNRLVRAWQKPATVIVHEQVWNFHARMADIVLPTTTTLERDDIGFASREPLLVAMRALLPRFGHARDDHAIFAELAGRLGHGLSFTEDRTTMQWLRHMYDEWSMRMREHGHGAPPFERFWSSGALRLPRPSRPSVMLREFREDPLAHPLRTPSGRIELHSRRIASFGYADCPGHPVWLEPSEWLGSPLAERFPLHLLSDQPANKLHSQLDFSEHSRSLKIGGREPLMISPADAAARGIAPGDTVRVSNDRGVCLAGALISDGVRPGVVKLSTGAWWDPEDPGHPEALDRHGNPNVLTRDAGSSKLGQGCSAQTCLVQVRKFNGADPPVRAFEAPDLEQLDEI